MTRITTGCPRCGRVELAVDDVTLVVSPREEHAWYLFDCYDCAEQVVKPAPSTLAMALTSVRVRTWTVPAEVLERVGPTEAPRLGVDDLLDVLIDLSHEADLVHRAAGAPPDRQAERGGAARPAPGDVVRPSPGEAEDRPARPNAV